MTDNQPAETIAPPKLDELIGLWRRASITWPDGRMDATTFVAWLQGPSFYADLRLPADRPGFAGIDCLRRLRREHVVWLARQEGFAGKLLNRDGDFEWRRAIDLQPPAVHPDVGRLRFAGESLVEEGSIVPYVEDWRRAAAAAAPVAALALRNRANGVTGLILRVGATFMYVRSRPAALPPHRTLADCVGAAASLREAQDMLDCEISLGTVAGPCWTIERSSLPFREGHDLGPRFAAVGQDTIETADVTPDGVVATRRWEVTDEQGAVGELANSFPAAVDDGNPRPGLTVGRGP